MPTIKIDQQTNKLIIKAKQTVIELDKIKQQHQTPKGLISLGPMNNITPWTKTGTKINILNQEVQNLIAEIGRRIVLEQ